METKANYMMVGAGVIVLIFGLLLTALWLSVGLNSKDLATYAVYVNEPVSGLNVQAPVKFNGVGVGEVRKIALNENNPQQVLLLLDIEKGVPITASTTAVLQTQGITGIRYVELKAGARFAEPLKKMAGEAYPVIPSRPSLLVQLDSSLTDITENIQTFTDAVSNVLDKDNALAIKGTLRNLEQLTNVLAQQADHLTNALVNTDRVTTHWAQLSERLPATLISLENTIKTVDGMALQVRQAGHKAAVTMHSGHQAMRLLTEQTIPKVTQLAVELERTARNIKGLSQELKQDPSMLIRGRTPKALGPGE